MKLKYILEDIINESILKGLKNAWLNPKGRIVFRHKEFHNSGAGWHNELASCILMDKWKLEYPEEAHEKVMDMKFDYQPMEYLEDNGWIRLHGFGGRTPVWIANERKITKKQKETVEEWCMENGRDFNTCFAK